MFSELPPNGRVVPVTEVALSATDVASPQLDQQEPGRVFFGMCRKARPEADLENGGECL